MSTITISKKAVEQLVARIAAAKALTMAEARRVLEELVAGAMAGTVPVDAAAHPAGSESEVWTLSAAPYPCLPFRAVAHRTSPSPVPVRRTR